MGLQTRTTGFSCDGDKEDYDENLLMSRPLPWVVRVYFESENSMKGTLCSGMLYYILNQRPNTSSAKIKQKSHIWTLPLLKSIRIYSTSCKFIFKTFIKL